MSSESLIYNAWYFLFLPTEMTTNAIKKTLFGLYEKYFSKYAIKMGFWEGSWVHVCVLLGQFSLHCCMQTAHKVLFQQEEVRATTPQLEDGKFWGKRCWATQSKLATFSWLNVRVVDGGSSSWGRLCRRLVVRSLCLWEILFEFRWQRYHCYFSHPLVPLLPSFLFLFFTLRCCNCSEIEGIWRTVTAAEEKARK